MVFMPHWPLCWHQRNISYDYNSPIVVLSVLKLLNNPHKALRNIFHITGTNGKGSTAFFISNILLNAKYNINIYTSPHIHECNDCIVINGTKISDDLLFKLTEKVRYVCEKYKIDITFFECMTIIAMLSFAKSNADANIIEVGMGGRFDATNIFEKDQVIVNIFTPIHIDHVKFLGSTPEENAKEKVSIIKQNSNVIIAPQSKFVHKTITSHARYNMCKVYSYGIDYWIEKIENKPEKILFFYYPHLIHLKNKIKYTNLDSNSETSILDNTSHNAIDFNKYNFKNLDITSHTLKDSEDYIEILRPNLLGDHQLINYGVALMSVICCNNFNINLNSLIEYQNFVDLPSRMQLIKDNYILDKLNKDSVVYNDGAHNISGAFVLANFLSSQELFTTKYIVVGRTKNNNNYDFLKQFLGIVKMVISVRVKCEALPEAPELITKASIEVGINSVIANDLMDAMNIIKNDCFDKRVCVIICGSLYLSRDVELYKK